MAASGGDWGIVGVSLVRPDQRDSQQQNALLVDPHQAAPGGPKELGVVA